MERLVTVKEMRDRYGCSNPTARKYLRQCSPHMENPLAAPEWAVEEWERSRMAVPAGRIIVKPPVLKNIFVPRKR